MASFAVSAQDASATADSLFNMLDEITVVSDVIDVAVARETPVAVSTISPSDISLKVGNMEFPEIMNTTPGVYATKQGGGYGDSRISLRGFDQTNTSFLINGQPVNDMENGRLYWSNWQGLTDVASGIQIQRGLGASKLAVPSVGGTISIFTKAADDMFKFSKIERLIDRELDKEQPPTKIGEGPQWRDPNSKGRKPSNSRNKRDDKPRRDKAGKDKPRGDRKDRKPREERKKEKSKNRLLYEALPNLKKAAPTASE